MTTKTTDLCDEFHVQIQVAEPLFNDYGGVVEFSGEIATVRVYEDNVLVHQALNEPGHGRVLVVDGGGSRRTALFGGKMGTLAHKNGWSGLIIHGAVRDYSELAIVPIGVKALCLIPLRPGKQGKGTRDIPVMFAGVSFSPGHYVYADEDGIVVAQHPLV